MDQKEIFRKSALDRMASPEQLDMLMRITPANDAKAHHSRQVPSLLVEGMTLAGA